jgi:hypothetical protein
MNMQAHPFLGMRARAETMHASYFSLIYYFIMARQLCRHLEKLDRLPLDESFDFTTHLGTKAFLYLGRPSRGSALWSDAT